MDEEKALPNNPPFVPVEDKSWQISWNEGEESRSVEMINGEHGEVAFAFVRPHGVINLRLSANAAMAVLRLLSEGWRPI